MFIHNFPFITFVVISYNISLKNCTKRIIHIKITLKITTSAIVNFMFYKFFKSAQEIRLSWKSFFYVTWKPFYVTVLMVQERAFRSTTFRSLTFLHQIVAWFGWISSLIIFIILSLITHTKRCGKLVIEFVLYATMSIQCTA